MCTNFTPTQNRAWARQTLSVDLPSDYPPEAYPGYVAPIVVQGHHSGRVACGLARFGLVPPWAKDEKISRHTYNARTETAAQKPSYRHAWSARQYALVLVDDFFEPHYGSGKPVRWRIAQANREPFALAALWERWTDPRTQHTSVSFSLLTVNADAHPVMRQFHPADDEKRTPVVVAPGHFNAWLGAQPHEAAAWLQQHAMPALEASPAPRP